MAARSGWCTNPTRWQQKMSNGFYIGSAGNMKTRWNCHKSLLRKGLHHSVKLQRSWNKHGEEAFEFKSIEVVTDISLLLRREEFYIEKYKSWNDEFGYNILRIPGEVFRKSRIEGLHYNPSTKVYHHSLVQITTETEKNHPVINHAIAERLRSMIRDLCMSQDCVLRDFLWQSDRVHLLVDFSVTISVSDLVTSLKTITSREIRKEFQHDLSDYPSGEKVKLWKRGYACIDSEIIDPGFPESVTVIL